MYFLRQKCIFSQLIFAGYKSQMYILVGLVSLVRHESRAFLDYVWPIIPMFLHYHSSACICFYISIFSEDTSLTWSQHSTMCSTPPQRPCKLVAFRIPVSPSEERQNSVGEQTLKKSTFKWGAILSRGISGSVQLIAPQIHWFWAQDEEECGRGIWGSGCAIPGNQKEVEKERDGE